MSSPPVNLHLLDQIFSASFETSDALWPLLQERCILLPNGDHKPTGSSILGMFQEQDNSPLAKTSIDKELSDNIPINYQIQNSLSSPPEVPIFQETCTCFQVSDHNKTSSELFLGDEFSTMAMSSINEGFAENILYHHKDSTFFNQIDVSNNSWPASFGDSSSSPVISTTGELDSIILLEQENSIMESTLKDCLDNSMPLPTNDNSIGGAGMEYSAILEQEKASLDESSIDKELQGNKVKKKEIKPRFRRPVTQKEMVQPHLEEGSASKKQEHNAREKVRRMKLNASYLALGSLLPNTRKSKKRWCAPVIIDKVLEYIPELESEIEELTLKKNSIAAKIKNKQPADEQNTLVQLQAPTVSVHEVRHGEVIIQICMQMGHQHKLFSNLLLNLESQGMIVSSASSIHVCDDRICYHVHIQMNENPVGAEYVAATRNKVISWLSI